MDPETQDEAAVRHELGELLFRSAGWIVEAGATARFASFLDWLRPEAVALLGSVSDMDEAQLRAATTNIAVAIWNATPQPARRFQAAPLALPGRNDPCLCGSGSKYKRCCQRGMEFSALDLETMLEMVLDHLPLEEADRAARERLIPSSSVGAIASDWLEQGEPERALALLSPLFERPASELRRLDGRHARALDVYLDAHEAAPGSEHVEEVVDRMARHLRPPLRAGASLRQAMLAAARGEVEAVHRHIESAREDDPDNPDSIPTELAIYTTTADRDAMRECAQYWLGQLRREGDPADGELVTFLERVVADPEHGMLAATTSGDVDLDLLGRFLSMVRAGAERPLPELELVPLRLEHGAIELVVPAGDPELARAWSEVLPWQAFGLDGDVELDADDGVEAKPDTAWGDDDETAWADVDDAEDQESEEEDDEDSGDDEGETRWDDDPGEDDDSELVWHEDVASGWMGFLEGHPEAMDDLAILDHLVSAISHLPGYPTPLHDRLLALPLLRRARASVDAMLSRARAVEGAPRLAWRHATNRRALRLLYDEMEIRWRLDDEDPEAARRLLELDPDDHLGAGDFLEPESAQLGDDVPPAGAEKEADLEDPAGGAGEAPRGGRAAPRERPGR